MVKFYGYKKCGTCRKAEKYLESCGVALKFIDITENPPPAAELKKIIKQSGVPVKKCFNTSGVVYRTLKVKTKIPKMSDGDMIHLLSQNGRLLKRPMVLGGRKATVGFIPEIYRETWAVVL